MIHLVAILEFYRHFLPRGEQIRAPLSWMVGQTLLGLVFLFAYAIDKHLPWPRELKTNILAALAIVVAATCLVAMTFLAFPHEPPIHPQNRIARPRDLLPSVIFLAAPFVLKCTPPGDRFASE